MQREGGVERRFDRRQHHGQVLGLAARHHRVDRNLLDSELDQVGRAQAQNLAGIAAGAREHPEHPLLGGDDDRKAVGPAALVDRLDLVLVIAERDAARVEPRLAEADPEVLQGAGLDVQRSAARPHRREVRADARHAADALPFGAVPAVGARHFLAAVQADQGGHDLDAEPVRYVQRGVVDAGLERLGEAGVVLRVDGEPAPCLERREHRRGQYAGRAVALDHRDQAVGRQVHLWCGHLVSLCVAPRSRGASAVCGAVYVAADGGSMRGCQ